MSISILEKFMEYTDEKKDSKENLEEKLASHEFAFDWLHAGRLSMPIAELTSIIKSMDNLPVRTGHLGNWQEIAAGRSGALDHNNAVCGKKNLAYPLILDTNQTENTSMDYGDTVYLPGSIVYKDQRKELPLFSWDGKKFSECSRSASHFVPFVLAPFQDQLTPLTTIHRQHFPSFSHTKFNSSEKMKHHESVKEILRKVIKYIQVNENSDLNLTHIIDRSITISGKMTREKLQYVNGKFHMGEVTYSSVDELVEAAFLPIFAAHNPRQFFSNIKEVPQQMLGLSLQFSCVLDYIFHNSISKNANTFNLYLEWGAFDSAGYPPRVKGYFKKRANLLKKIYSLCIQLMPEIKPTYFILLPSAIFNLLPNNAYSNDAVYTDALFTAVNESTEKNANLEMHVNKIHQIVKDWFFKNKNNLSPYYLGRFTRKRCIHDLTHQHEYGEAMESAQFDKLTLQQTCMILGALHEIAKDEEIQ